MITLAHCKMNQNDIDEYLDFYDYSKENERIIWKYFLDDKHKWLNICKEDL